MHDSPDEDATRPDELIVTDVRTGRSRKQPRLIYIDGEFSFRLSEDICLKFGLFRGARLSEERIAEIQAEEERYQAKQAALRLVSHRLRSAREIDRKLREKGFSPSAVETAQRFLREYGMIDDAEFASAFVNDQLLRRPLGRRRLEQELRKKGVDSDTIRSTLDDIDGESEYERALAAAEKKAPTIRATDRIRWERSMASFLSGRGFGWDVVSQVMEHLKERPDSPLPGFERRDETE